MRDRVDKLRLEVDAYKKKEQELQLEVDAYK
jgi:hypothetical protein